MLNILEKYDVLLVDAYGVFWNGADFINGTKQTLESMVGKGKTVLILSNTSGRSTNAIEKYAKLGLIEGKHYHYFVTSGEVAYQALKNNFTVNGNRLKKYYTFGTPNHAIFAGLDYYPSLLNEADFVYIGIPQFTQEQKESLDSKYPLYESYSSAKSGESYWDTTEILAFLPMLEKIIKTALPILNANPDLIAPEKCKKTNSTNFVVRQGAIAKLLENHGMNIHHFGKPYIDVYDFCRKLVLEQRIYSQMALKNAKILMIGDTMETDILGAHNTTSQLGWQIDSMLTLTGNSGLMIDDSKPLQENFVNYSYLPDYIVTSFGINGTVVS